MPRAEARVSVPGTDKYCARIIELEDIYIKQNPRTPFFTWSVGKYGRLTMNVAQKHIIHNYDAQENIQRFIRFWQKTVNS